MDSDMDTDSDFEDDGKKHGSGGLKVKSKFSKGGNNVLPADKSDIGDHVLRIMEEFPLLSSWKDFKYWTGFIQGESKLTRISVSVPNFPSSFEAIVQGDRESVKILSSFQAEILKLANSTNGSLLNLLKEIKLMLNKYEDDEASQSNSAMGRDLSVGARNPEFLLTILNELDLIGAEHAESATKDFTELSMKYVDQLRRKHIIKYEIPPKYPHAPVKVCVDLPPPSDRIDWPSKLSNAFDRFKSEVDRYVIFWSVLDELDNQARVIDPVQPKRGDIHRRILLNQNVVVNLVFNPLCPKALPEIKFSGPEKSIYELDAMIDEHCKEWSEDKSILENLEDVLQREFLLKSDEDDDNHEGSGEDMESLCVICYAFEFEGNVPETTCECGSIYHDKCLSDLLVNDCSVKSKRFCVDCPACGMELKVSKSHKVTW